MKTFVQKLSNHFSIFKGQLYSCRFGQGEYGKEIKSLRVCDLRACENECKKLVDCAAVDYTRQFCDENTCRLFRINEPRENAGIDQRVYCEHVGKVGNKTGNRI